MREYIVDRREGDILVCFDGEAELHFPAPAKPGRAVGERVLVFESNPGPYVDLSPSPGILLLAEIYLIPPDEKRTASVRKRFDSILEKGIDKGPSPVI